MSIYGSIWLNGKEATMQQLPVRDQYSGQPLGDRPTMLVDVATATSFHDLVRVSIDGHTKDGDPMVLLTEEQTGVLIEMLEGALARIRNAKGKK